MRPSVEANRARENGCERASGRAQMGQHGQGWALGRMATGPCSGEPPGRPSYPTRAERRMRRDPLVSLFALGLVATPALLLVLTRAVWTLVLALLSIVAALALLAGELGATFADADEPGTPPERRAMRR